MSSSVTIASLRRALLWRLCLVWFFVSLVATGLGYFVELRAFEQGLVAVATEEIRTLSQLPSPLDAQQQLWVTESRRFVKQNYVWIQVYDAQGRIIQTLENPEHAALRQRLPVASGPWDGGPHFQALEVDEQPLFRVRVSVPTVDKPLHLEGLFLIDPLTMQQQRHKVWRTLFYIFVASLVTVLAIYPIVLALYRSLMQATKDALRGNLEMAAALGNAIAKRDSETGEHNFRVTIYAIKLAELVGLPAKEMQALILGSFLHDIGKIGIPDAVLLKPGPLSEQEREVMREHVALGLDIVANAHWLHEAQVIIACHHEQFDGSGYPHSLKGSEIPFAARIFAIVDVFDALTSQRPYKTALTAAQAMEKIQEEAGSHFDPDLLQRFLSMAPETHREIQGLSEAQLLERLVALLPKYFFDSLWPRRRFVFKRQHKHAAD